ncbi:MAG: transcriptional repressor NrdR [Chloroflexi bacterium]|nr:transcriptional repressor NrdR [Chloroflexota bacterium]
MKCPFCGHPDSKVIDSRTNDDGVRRRRECLRCGLRFSTAERVQATALMVIKRDGRREEFNRDKVMSGLQNACAKRPLAQGVLGRVVDEIEGELQKLGRAEVPSSLIGEMVMERLRKIDHIAYVRFASVYREFKDVVSFKEEIESLLAQQQAREAARPAGAAALANVTPLPAPAASAQLSLLPGAPAAQVIGRRGRRRKEQQALLLEGQAQAQR